MTKAVPLSRTLPPILKLDTVEAITGYTHYLLMKAQKAGNMVFDGHKPSKEEITIAKKLQELTEFLERRLRVCDESDVADILDCYDMAYRVGFRRLPDASTLNRHKNRVLKVWKSNKGEIAESSVFGLTADNAILRNWVGTLVKHNTFPAITTYEKYKRLALIMRENLDRYADDASELKQRWYEANKVDDLSSLGSTILRAYRQFISSIPASIIGFAEKMNLDNQVLRELSTRTDLDPYDQAAFRLALSLTESQYG